MDVITTHLNADFDCLASMVAAKKLYPDAKLVFPGAQEKNVRDFLQRVDFPFEYDSIKTIDLRQVTRLIIVDTKQIERIGEFAKIIHKPYVKIHLYDHHPNTAKDFEAELDIVEDVGATTTILIRLLQQQQIPLTPMEATVLALGIYEDTGSLTFTSTREADFLAAAYLFTQGANLSMVAEFINRQMTPVQVRLLNDLMLSKKEIVIEGTPIAIAKASSNRYIGDAAYIVHKWKEMENLDVVFALIRMDSKVHLVARSRSALVNVGRIAAEFGGGGHPYAASASIKQMALHQAEDELIRLLYKYIQEAHVAAKIMSSPVLCVESGATIQTTKSLLDGYTVNTLVVLDAQGVPLGYITRQIVQRAMYHGLDREPVDDYMLTDMKTIVPETPFSDIELLMIQRPQKIVPVVNERGQTLGVITKNDILKVLQENKLEEQAYYQHPDHLHARNARRLMDERLPEPVMRTLRELGELGDELGYAVYVVGGFVRDLLLRAEDNLDIDIVAEGDGIRFAEIFAKRAGARVRVHRKFCTAVVIFPDGFKIDVATARTEHYEYPAAMPIVRLGSIRLDLMRRDFTMNALAIKLNPKFLGKVYDYFGGQRDLKEKTVRVLHSLSFVEDPTRIFRAIRFEQRFHFHLGTLTQSLAKNALKRGYLGKLSGTRVLNELELILHEPNPLAILERMDELGVLDAIHPQLAMIDEIRTLFRNIRAVIAWYELMYRDEPIEAWLVYFAGMIDRMGSQDAQEFCRYLQLNSVALHKVQAARQGYKLMERPLFEKSETLRNSDMYAIFKDVPMESMLFWMAKTRQESVKKAASLYLSKLRDVKLFITGKDLVALGAKPGPAFQQILGAVLDAKLNGEISTKEQEIERAKELLGLRQKRSVLYQPK